MVEHSRKSFVHKLSRGLSYSSQVVESSKNKAVILHPYSLRRLRFICGGLKNFIYTKNPNSMAKLSFFRPVTAGLDWYLLPSAEFVP